MLTPEEREMITREMQDESCAAHGFYEVSQGYRRIPGNICEGGYDLSPAQYPCSTSGFFVHSIFSMKGFFMTAIFAAVMYIGWPVIEGVLILLPIPDPIQLRNKIARIAGSVSSSGKGLASSLQSKLKKPNGGEAGY